MDNEKLIFFINFHQIQNYWLSVRFSVQQQTDGSESVALQAGPGCLQGPASVS